MRVRRCIDDSPVGLNGCDGSVNPAADEAQLGLAVGGVHVERVAIRLAHTQGAALVGGEHHPLHVMGIFPRNLDDGLVVKQLHLLSLTVCIASNGGPDGAVAELEADE